MLSPVNNCRPVSISSGGPVAGLINALKILHAMPQVNQGYNRKINGNSR